MLKKQLSLRGAAAVARRSRSKPAAPRNWIPSLRSEQAAQSLRDCLPAVGRLRFARNDKTFPIAYAKLNNIKEKYPDIEWKKIAGLRDILAHEYFGVDLEVLWDIIESKMPILKKQIAGILKNVK